MQNENAKNSHAGDAAQEEFWVDLPAPVLEVVEEMHASRTDPQGSWTGLPLASPRVLPQQSGGSSPAAAEAEVPVQDADDL